MARQKQDSLSPFAAGRTEMSGATNTHIYRPHGLQDWTLHYTYAGLGRISSGDQHYYSPPGDILLHKPRIVSDYGIEDSQQQWTHLWSTFQMPRDWFSLLSWPEVLPGIFILHIDEAPMRQRIEHMLLDIIDLYHSPQYRRMEICLSILHTVLIYCDSITRERRSQRLDTRVQQVMQFMHDHLARPLSLQQLADESGLSVSRLSHLFREETGLTPMQYLERERIQRACNALLMSARPIAQIAEDVGISDPAYFTRIFRRQCRMTPRAWRQQSQS